MPRKSTTDRPGRNMQKLKLCCPPLLDQGRTPNYITSSVAVGYYPCLHFIEKQTCFLSQNLDRTGLDVVSMPTLLWWKHITTNKSGMRLIKQLKKSGICADKTTEMFSCAPVHKCPKIQAVLTAMVLHCRHIAFTLPCFMYTCNLVSTWMFSTWSSPK